MKKSEIGKMDAPLLEMPKEQWLDRLDLFSARHHGWKSTLEVSEGAQTARFEAHDLPFEGINVDQRGSDIVEVTLEKGPNDRVVHIISRTRKILWRTPDELEIESEDGSRTILHCSPPE